jgi:ubiquinone/menaquinone biosynthesis C-methylase UbiE
MQGHDERVAAQFGARANAYVESSVHAQGADLDALAALARTGAVARVLDLGCGGGHVGFTLAPHVAEVIAYDLSPQMLAAVATTAAQRGLGNITTVAGPAERLLFADASFDLIVSRYSAHHWRDVRAGIAEARRVLAPGGRGVFIDVVAPEAVQSDTLLQTIEVLRDRTHVRDYTPAEWRGFVEAAGFTVAHATLRRLRLEFSSWVARMQTPAEFATAIRALQSAWPREVAATFDLEADGSFTVDTLMLEAVPA